jgi:hypothetical protein
VIWAVADFPVFPELAETLSIAMIGLAVQEALSEVGERHVAVTIPFSA